MKLKHTRSGNRPVRPEPNGASVEFQCHPVLSDPQVEPAKASVPLNVQYLTNGGVTPTTL
jgi:hypothetical protein